MKKNQIILILCFRGGIAFSGSVVSEQLPNVMIFHCLAWGNVFLPKLVLWRIIWKYFKTKSSSWSVWLLHCSFLSSHHCRIWTPSSSTLNTVTNICHVLFAFASSPLGKRQVQRHGQFWSGFSLYETGLGFLSKRHFSELQWEKARWKKRMELLGWQARIFVQCGWVVLTSLTLSWENGWSHWDFLVWERSRAESKGQMCSLLDNRKWSESWLDSSLEPRTLPRNAGASLAMAGDEQQSHFWKLWCQSFGLGFTLIHRLSKVRFFWLRGGKHDAILGLLVLVLEGLELWEPGNPTLMCNPSAGSGLRSWTSSALLTVWSRYRICVSIASAAVPKQNSFRVGM